MRIRRTLTGLAVLVILLFGSLWLDHRKETMLPVPTGPFAVGRANSAWSDAGAKRELVVWIWYPAEAGAPVDDYLPAPWRAAEEQSFGGLMKFLTRDPGKVHGHSMRNAAVSGRQRSYPVAIMRGGASSEITNYSTLAEDLASHGYVVVGFDAPYRTRVVVFPDGRVMTRTPENNPELCLERAEAEQASCAGKIMEAWTADVGFVVDRLEQLNSADASGRFTGRLDMTRVGVFGHSFGGATALEFCHEDARCKAGIDLDGEPFGSVIQAGLQQPFLFVLSDQIDGKDAGTRRVLGDIQSIYDRLPVEGRLRVLIRGANHFLFSDDGALLKSHIVMRALRMCGIVGIDGRRQLAVTAYCVRSFFDAYLTGTGGAGLKMASADYPEIQVLQ